MKNISAFVLAALAVAMTAFMPLFPAFAQEVAAAIPAPVVLPDQVCMGSTGMYTGIAAGIVTGASLLANIVPATSTFGKLLHLFALNFTVKKK